MGLTVNPVLATDEDTPAAELPAGVYLEADYPEGKVLPDGWVELFRVNNRVYGIKTHVDPGVVFRLMRELRKGGSEEMALTTIMYDILGDEVMEVLATEKLSEEEFTAVMKAVNKHAGGAISRVLGK